MKKLKFGLMTAAIIIAIGSAFASKPTDLCEMDPQYYKVGSSYVLTGEIGVTYVCVGTGGVCTYTHPNPVTQPDYYGACRPGTYTPFNDGIK